MNCWWSKKDGKDDFDIAGDLSCFLSAECFRRHDWVVLTNQMLVSGCYCVGKVGIIVPSLQHVLCDLETKLFQLNCQHLWAKLH